MDTVSKPCYYTGKGKSKGSYIRVGEADLPMTEYEIYSYDAFKFKTEDELRTNKRIDESLLDSIQVDGFIAKAVSVKPNLVNMDKKTLMTMSGLIDKNGLPTVCGIMLFGKYPQYLSPNLDIVAVVCATKNYAEESESGERFIVNKRLDGTIPQMLESGLAFVQQNIAKSTVIDNTGHRNDVSEYPVKAIREIILNALIHRDYSIHRLQRRRLYRSPAFLPVRHCYHSSTKSAKGSVSGYLACLYSSRAAVELGQSPFSVTRATKSVICARVK